MVINLIFKIVFFNFFYSIKPQKFIRTNTLSHKKNPPPVKSNHLNWKFLTCELLDANWFRVSSYAFVLCSFFIRIFSRQIKHFFIYVTSHTYQFTQKIFALNIWFTRAVQRKKIFLDTWWSFWGGMCDHYLFCISSHIRFSYKLQIKHLSNRNQSHSSSFCMLKLFCSTFHHKHACLY